MARNMIGIRYLQSEALELTSQMRRKVGGVKKGGADFGRVSMSNIITRRGT